MLYVCVYSYAAVYDVNMQYVCAKCMYICVWAHCYAITTTTTTCEWIWPPSFITTDILLLSPPSSNKIITLNYYYYYYQVHGQITDKELVDSINVTASSRLMRS